MWSVQARIFSNSSSFVGQLLMAGPDRGWQVPLGTGCDGGETAVSLWCAQTGVGGWIAMVALWVLVVGLVVWGVARLFPARADDDSLTALDARLAAGTIDLATYQRIRSELDRPARTSI
jgi:hypothetical protein